MPRVFHADPAWLALPAPELTPELLEFLAAAYGLRSDGLPPRDLGGAFNLNVLIGDRSWEPTPEEAGYAAIAEQLADLMRTAELPSQRQQRAELVDKRGPDCDWWLAALRDGGMSAVTFAAASASSVTRAQSQRGAESSLVSEDISPEPNTNANADPDSATFERQVEPLRRELHAHCYRMLGSVHDADDAVQEAMLRAWRGLATFEGRSSLRTWLYAVATNACLDQIAARQRRALPVDLGPASERAVVEGEPRADVAWLGPYPDSRYEQREAVELAFVAALQHLPGNQRAALLLFDVLGFSVAEIAEMMATSTTSVNSALARARRMLAARVPDRAQQQAPHKLEDPRLREVVVAFAKAFERHDTEALVALLTADVTWSMPPLPHWYSGVTAVADFARRVPMELCPSWRHQIVSANGQPAVALYLGEHPDAEHTAWSINVLTLRGERIAGIVSFLDTELFTKFELPGVM